MPSTSYKQQNDEERKKTISIDWENCKFQNNNDKVVYCIELNQPAL